LLRSGTNAVAVLSLPFRPDVTKGDASGMSTNFATYGSLFLIGVALALAGFFGIFLPRGFRAGVVLSLVAGAGVGVAGVALGSSAYSDGDPDAFVRVFFDSSVAGFLTVVAGLAASRWRAGRNERTQPPAG
jgi:Na+/proline symporter